MEKYYKLAFDREYIISKIEYALKMIIGNI